MRPHRSWLPRVVGWVLVPALGVILRMAPAMGPPGGTWTHDEAGHYRLVATLVADGHLPTPDRFTDLPDGRDLGRFLPLAFYHACAVGSRVLAALGVRDFDLGLHWLMAVFGALVAWPVWLGARALGARPWGAVVATLVAVAAPAHLQRTTAFLLRYEGLGTVLATAHLALAAAALSALSPRQALIRSILSGLALVGALATWRVTLVVPALEIAVVVALAIWRPPGPAVRRWAVATAVALVASGLLFEYLRSQSFLLSPIPITIAAAVAMLHLPTVTAPASRRAARTAMLVLGIGAALAAATRWGASGDYGAVGAVVRSRLSGASRADWLTLDPIVAVMLTVLEFRVTDPRAFVGPGMFSALGLWLVAAPVVIWSLGARRTRSGDPGLEEARRFMIGLALGLVALTLLITRNRILLAPVVAILAGPMVTALAPGAGTRRSWAARATLVALVPCVAFLARDAVGLARADRPTLEPGWVEVLAWLREHTPPATPVLSAWERGYEIQLHARRPTIVDGLLESPVNRRHLVGSARAFLARSPDSLAALCRGWGVEYVVVPPARALFGVAMAARDPLVYRLMAGRGLSPEQGNRVLVRMMLAGTAEPPFVPVFERGGYRVYRRPPDGAGVTTAPARAILPASTIPLPSPGASARDR